VTGNEELSMESIMKSKKMRRSELLRAHVRICAHELAAGGYQSNVFAFGPLGPVRIAGLG